jgi:hypothetical protein
MSKKAENIVKFWAIGLVLVQMIFGAGMFYATQKQIIPKLELIALLAHKNELEIAVIKSENEAMKDKMDYLHRDDKYVRK